MYTHPKKKKSRTNERIIPEKGQKMALTDTVTTQENTSHICIITKKRLIQLQLKLHRITYKTQSHLLRNSCDT